MINLRVIALAALLCGCGQVSTGESGGSGSGGIAPPPAPGAIVMDADPVHRANPSMSSPTDQTFQVELKSGWNAVALQTDFVTEVVADDSVVGFVTYENGQYSLGLPLTTTALNEGEGASLGVFIYATAASTLRYRGTPLEGVQYAGLEPGWNLIAPPAARTDGLMAENDSGPLELTPSIAAQVYEVSPELHYRLLDLRQPQPLDASKPYWVFTSQNILLMEKHTASPTTAITPGPPVTVRPDVPDSGFVCGPDHVDDALLRGAAYYKNVRWPTGSTLNVLFIDGNSVPDKVYQEAARLVNDSWGSCSNLTFTFTKGDSDAADKTYHIRVTFLVDKGYNSYIGTNSQYYNPSMNLSRLHTRPLGSPTFLRVVRHEFGHALGRVHEHQNPNVDINWDKEAVCKDMAGSPSYWSRQTTEYNYFRTISSDLASPFDPLSVMLYQIKPSWTTDGFSTGYATDLSDIDREYSGKAYP